MASRTRVISQNKAVYVTPTGWTIDGVDNTITGQQLHRVDTFSFEMDLAGSRQDVREFGQLARIGTVNLTEVNPTLSFGYYLGNGENEMALGFCRSTESKTGQMASGQLSEDVIRKERNVWLLNVGEGEDAFNSNNFNTPANILDHDVVGFGNCFISSYSANFSVGDIPRADIEMQASNIAFFTGMHSGMLNPSLNLEAQHTFTGLTELPQPSSDVSNIPLVLRPQNVSITFSEAGDGVSLIGGPTYSDLPIQSASIELPLAREVIESLGTELAYAKVLEFPIDVSMSISSLTRDFATGALEYALTGAAENNKTDITLNVKDDDGQNQMTYILQGAVLDNQSFSQGLDDNETVDLTFSAQIGGATTTDQGLFFKPQAQDIEYSVGSGDANDPTSQPIKIPLT